MICKQLKQDFDEVRADLLKAREQHPPIRATSDSDPTPPTWGEIMDVFIYGDRAHGNREKRRRVEAWRRHERTYVLHNYFFVRFLSIYASGISFLGGQIEAELARHSQPMD